MAAGDALDQVLSQLDSQQQQQRAQRRVPAPQPTAQVSPVPAPQAGGGGRAASPTPPESGPSFLGGLRDAAAKALDTVIPGLGTMTGLAVTRPDVVKGAAAGILRSPVTAAAGIADLAGDVGGAISPKADFRNYQGSITHAGLAFRYTPDQAQSISSFSRDIDPVAQAGNPTANETAAQMASLAIGYGAGAKLWNLAKLPEAGEIASSIGNPLLRATATTGLRAAGLGGVNAVMMDPETERFSNTLQNLGVHNEFTDWLAHDDQEGHWAGRFKNAVEGLGLGLATEPLLKAGGYWKARLSGDNAAADLIQSHLAAESDGQVPDYHIEETPGAPPASTKEPGYVGGWEDAPDGTVRPVYEDDPLKTAEPEQKAAASDDGIPPPQDSEKMATVLPNQGEAIAGVARPMDPLMMAKAMGDKEAEEAILSFRAKRFPGDPGIEVGPVDREGIAGLAKDVNFWRGARDSEGERAIDVTPGTDTAAQHGEFRLGNIGSQRNVAPLLRAMVDRIPETAPRSDADLMTDAARAAHELGEDPSALLEASRLISGKLSDADTAMAVLRTVWKRAADDLDGLPGTDWASAPQEEVDKAAERIYNMLAISSHVQDAKAGLGRGLRVNQLPDADTYLNTVQKADTAPEGTYGPNGPLPRTRQELQNWFELWQATGGDPQLRADFLEGALTRSVPAPGTYLRQAFPNFFTSAVLSAPRTHMLGFTGPTLMSILRNVERMSGGYLAAIGNPFLSAADRQANLIAASKASFNYVQTLQDATDALHWATQSAVQNRSQLHAPMTFDALRTAGPVQPGLAEAAGYNPNDVRYMLGNAINIFPRAIGRLYNFTDELTQRLAYYGEVRARALVEGASNGLDGEDLHQFIRGKLKAANDTEATDPNGNPSPTYGMALDPNALAAAQSNSFLGPVGSDGSWVRRVADGINGMRRDYPELRYLLPVFNVPANILGQIIKRTPLAFVPGFGLKQTAAELAGEMGPIAQAEAHGRILTGSAFLTAGLLLSRAGLLTGAGPQEGTARKVWEETHEPWSLRVGDNWVRLDRYDTAGGLITIPATIADATQYTKQDEKVGDLMMSGVGALAEWFKDRASLRTAAALMEIGDDPTVNVGNKLNSISAATAASFLVPNAVQTLVTQQMDTTLRRKRAWLDYLKAATPGLSSTLPPVRNVLGEPVTRAADTLGEAVFPVTIAPAVTYKTDPVIDEIDRLYNVTGYAAGADPKALGYGFFHPQEVTLENGQSLYDAAMQARTVMTLHGLTLKQSLGKLFTSDAYNHAVDADPGQKVTSRGDASRGYMVEQTFNAYNKAIKAELAEGSPIANKWLTAAAAKQRDDAYLRDVNTEDLVSNPDLYRTHGIDPTVYSGKVRAGATGALANALRRR